MSQAQALKRLEKELRNFNEEEHDEEFSAEPMDENHSMFEWRATFPGPKDSPYEGGIFELRIEFPRNYPNSPPKIEFVTKIYHPSVHKTGRNCFDFLYENYEGDFTYISVYEILLKIQEALKKEVDSKHIYEENIWRQYCSDRKEFERIAREWTKKYAMDYTDVSEEVSKENEVRLVLIKFQYYSNFSFEIYGNLNEKLRNIVNRTIFGNFINKDSIVFLYAGSKIKTESLLSDIITDTDKDRNEMNIMVFCPIINQQDDENNSKIKSREIICPKCFESMNIKIQNYKIFLSNCKNEHIIKELTFKNFEKTQNIDLKNIVCNICNKKNKFNTNNNEFYKCAECKKNICQKCKSIHENTHNVINYDIYYSICRTHLESYNSYCKNCRKNLCMKCEKDHIKHEKIYFRNILPNPNEIRINNSELHKDINELNENIEDIIDKLTAYKENINKFYAIYTDIIKNVDTNNINYEILSNLNEINNNQVIKDIKNIVKEKNIRKKIDLILDICDKKEILSCDEITLIYKINNEDKRIKIFGDDFVKNNKNICRIIFKKKKYELESFFEVQDNKEELIIKLRGINNITNATEMFFYCDQLISLPDINKWNLINVVEKKDMFTGCSQSLVIPNQFINNS